LKQQALANITSRSEQQQQTVRQLEIESRDDELWDIFIENILKLSSTSSSSSLSSPSSLQLLTPLSSSSSSSSSSLSSTTKTTTTLQDFISTLPYNNNINTTTNTNTTVIIHRNNRVKFCDDLIHLIITNKIILQVKDIENLINNILKCGIQKNKIKLIELMKYIENCYKLQSYIDMILQKLRNMLLTTSSSSSSSSQQLPSSSSSSSTTTTTTTTTTTMINNKNNNNYNNNIDQNEYNNVLHEIKNIFTISHLLNISYNYHKEIQ